MDCAWCLLVQLHTYCVGAGVLAYRDLLKAHKQHHSLPFPHLRNISGDAAAPDALTADPTAASIAREAQAGAHAHRPPPTQFAEQLVSQSLGALQTTDTLVGPIYIEQDKATALFPDLPAQFRWHASLRKLAWERTVRCVNEHATAPRLVLSVKCLSVELPASAQSGCSEST